MRKKGGGASERSSAGPSVRSDSVSSSQAAALRAIEENMRAISAELLKFKNSDPPIAASSFATAKPVPADPPATATAIAPGPAAAALISETELTA